MKKSEELCKKNQKSIGDCEGQLILFQVYPIKKYNIKKEEMINIMEEYEIDELIDLLNKNDGCYHFRIHKNTNYIFFGDIDNLGCDFNGWAKDMILFLKNKYNISTEINEISYTSNYFKKGSFHYSIPKLYASCEKLREIHNNFNLEFCDKYNYKVGTINKKCVDTSIYSEHWFRIPNQSKESDKNTIHKIIKGEMKDFIVSHIPDNSISITNKNFTSSLNNELLNNKLSNNKLSNNKLLNNKVNNIIDNYKDDILMKYDGTKYSKIFTLYKKFFDECYKENRFNEYDEWSSVGMSLKNIYGENAFELFDYFSSKGYNYEGKNKTYLKYQTFEENNNKCKGIGSLYYYAKKDNLQKYVELLKQEDIIFMETDFCEKIFELAGDRFLYVKVGENLYHLYCYNGKYWERDDLLLKKYISNELFEYYKDYITTIYWGHQNFNKLKTQINNLKRTSFKVAIIETYKEYGLKYIDFDFKWWLLGFNNCVYDLKECKMREYHKEDFISMTTGYVWREPTDGEINIIDNIINKIMPNKDIRKLYKEILSTTLEGRCLEKFIVFNGDGRNGKGVIDELLLIALGNYGISANNSILFEKSKTGSNPEKANLHKKRLVIFKEPSSKNKFENSIVKELTGGGKFSARTHNEKETEKFLYNTTICECNKRPFFAEEPTNAEIGRLIDLHFGSSFTDIKEDIDPNKHIYEAVKEYKELPFQHKHKFALLKILMEAHKEYKLNNYNFEIPQSIRDRTIEYLESNCQLLLWFKENYELMNTNEKNIYVPIKNIHDKFKTSEYYDDLMKYERRKLTYKYFIEYFSQNIATKRQYKDRHTIKYNNKKTEHRNVLLFWKEKDLDTNNTDYQFTNSVDKECRPTETEINHLDHGIKCTFN